MNIASHKATTKEGILKQADNTSEGISQSSSNNFLYHLINHIAVGNQSEVTRRRYIGGFRHQSNDRMIELAQKLPGYEKILYSCTKVLTNHVPRPLEE